MYRLHFLSMVDIIKNLFCQKVFNKEIEFTIIQLAHRLSQVAYYIMFVCDDTYYTFLVYLGFTAS